MLLRSPAATSRRCARLAGPGVVGQRRRTHPAPARALLGDGAASAGSLIEAGLIVGAIALSAAPLFTGASARRNAAAATAVAQDRALPSGDGGTTEDQGLEEDEEADDVKWGAMSVIACVPLLNWLVRELGGLCVHATRA